LTLPSSESLVRWTPQEGPQTAAYNSDADVIGYGGEAGGGKTDLLLGVAGTKHTRSIIFRREFPRLEGIEARSREIFNAGGDARARDRYNETLHRWELASGATVRFAAMQYEADKQNFQGRPYDLHGFDEVTEFTESQFRFVTAWNRSTRPGQKCQVIMTFNPPLDETGAWVIKYFAPWIDSHHPHPAKDGEKRWFAMVDGKEAEVGPEPFEHDGETIVPKSRTFFHAGLKDNPILARTGYGSTIDALPEPLRSLLKGNFDAGHTANPFQVIPTEWVRAAQRRWADGEFSKHGRQSAIGSDVSRGGDDQTVLASLRGCWFDALLKYPGHAVPNGPTAAGLVIAALDGSVDVGVDIIGYGASCYDSLIGAGISALGVNFAEGTDWKDKSKKLRFRNVRAAAYWMFREALDPENKSEVCLPPDPELLADLCAPRWRLDPGSGKVVVEPKDEGHKAGWSGPTLKERLGRSPDCGDAVVIAWWTQYQSVRKDQAKMRSGHIDWNARPEKQIAQTPVLSDREIEDILNA
jgi:hypothetical protein